MIFHRTALGMMDPPDRWSTRCDTLPQPVTVVQHPPLTVTCFLPQFSLSADPSHWSIDKPEADDDFHRPDPRRAVLNDSGTMFTVHGLANLGRLSLILLGLVTLLSVSFLLFHGSRFLTCAVQRWIPCNIPFHKT